MTTICCNCGRGYPQQESTFGWVYKFCSAECKKDFKRKTSAGVGNPNFKNGNWIAKGKCACGNSMDIRALVCSSCGADAARTIKIGNVYGKWTALAAAGRSKNNLAQWLCKCVCGVEKAVNLRDIFTGRSSQCFNCSQAQRGKKPAWPQDKLPPSVWNAIVFMAKRRKIPVEVSPAYAQSIFEDQKKLCALTGAPIHFPISRADWLKDGMTASLDRINSSLGYVAGNLQWVHKDVNLMKNILSQDRFIELCTLITKNSTKRTT